jgi:hypothetical protein
MILRAEIRTQGIMVWQIIDPINRRHIGLVYWTLVEEVTRKQRKTTENMYLFQAARRASSMMAFRRFATSPAEGKPPPVGF